MKRILAVSALVLAGSLLSLQAEPHEFTDVQGRKLEGELVSVSGPQATIRRSADARVFTVAIAQFSPEDQRFMTDFAASHVHYDFEIKLTKDKQGTTKTKDNNVTYASDDWIYKIAVTNHSNGEAPDLRVDYWLFSKADDGKIKAGARVQQAGSTTLPALKLGATQQFQTKPVKLSRQELDGGFYYFNGAKNKSRDTMGGVAVRFFRGETEVFAWATDPDLLKKARGKAEMAGESDTSQ